MEQPKIIVSAAADQDLDAMLKEVNDGFDSGRVKKTQLASWIITCFRQTAFSKQMENIRAEHFDDVAHLKAVVKKLEEAKKNDGTIELEKLLSPLRTREARKPKQGAHEAKRDPAKP